MNGRKIITLSAAKVIPSPTISRFLVIHVGVVSVCVGSCVIVFRNT